MTGLLGGGHAIYLDASTGEARNLDCFVAVPSGAGAPMTQLEVPFGEELVHYAVGASSCAVPGLPAGLAELSRAHGRLPWRALVEPALRLARTGVAMPAAHASCLAMLEPVMTMREGARALRARRETARRRATCSTSPVSWRALELIRDEGASSVYSGSIAAALLELVADRNGTLTGADLRAYRAEWSAPVEARFAGQARADARRARGRRRDARPLRSGGRPVVAARRAGRRRTRWRPHDEPDRRRRRRERVRPDDEPRARVRRLGAGARPAPEQHARRDRPRPGRARAGDTDGEHDGPHVRPRRRRPRARARRGRRDAAADGARRRARERPARPARGRRTRSTGRASIRPERSSTQSPASTRRGSGSSKPQAGRCGAGRGATTTSAGSARSGARARAQILGGAASRCRLP